MSIRGARPLTVKYTARIYRNYRQPQINYRLKSRPNAGYTLILENGTSSDKIMHAPLNKLVARVAEHIQTTVNKENTIAQFHYIWGTMESLPNGSIRAGIPLMTEEEAEFDKELSSILRQRGITCRKSIHGHEIKHGQAYVKL